MCLVFFLACSGHEDKSGVCLCIMAESRSQLAPLSLRPHATNHPQQKWFAIQNLLQVEGTGSAEALTQQRVWHGMYLRNSDEVLG